MPVSPAEAEASGQEYIEVTFGGAQFRVPLDVDRWPLDLIRHCRLWDGDQERVVVAHFATAKALRQLLGDQWETMTEVAPKRRHVVELSNELASAAGIPRNVEKAGDVAFGGIPRLLSLLDSWPHHVESDLGHFWHLDYLDRWRFSEDGRRRLTLRAINARLSAPLPTTSALAVTLNGGKLPLSDAALVGMDIYERLFHQRHPSRPMSQQEAVARQAQARAEETERSKYRERSAKRRAHRRADTAIDNARANARRMQQGEAHAQENA